MPLDLLQLLGLLWIFLDVLGKQRQPVLVRFAAARADPLVEIRPHFFRHQELLVLRPTVSGFGEADFLGSQRAAVGPVRVLFVGRSLADHTADNDQRGRLVIGLELADSARIASKSLTSATFTTFQP